MTAQQSPSHAYTPQQHRPPPSIASSIATSASLAFHTPSMGIMDASTAAARLPPGPPLKVPLVMSERFKRSSTSRLIDESYRRVQRGGGLAATAEEGDGDDRAAGAGSGSGGPAMGRRGASGRGHEGGETGGGGGGGGGGTGHVSPSVAGSVAGGETTAGRATRGPIAGRRRAGTVSDAGGAGGDASSSVGRGSTTAGQTPQLPVIKHQRLPGGASSIAGGAGGSNGANASNGGGGAGLSVQRSPSANSGRVAPGSATSGSAAPGLGRGGGGSGGGGGQGNSNAANGGASAGGSGGKNDANENVGLDDITYTPFPLSTKSSFNPAGLSSRQMGRLDPLTRAKYMAYDKPPPSVAEQIGQSERRSRRWLKDEHYRIRQVVEAARKKWELLHKAIEDPNSRRVGEEGAAMARRRMREKVRKILQTREEELQFLVEGQSTSIDAIRLKEHLVIRDNKPKVDKLFSEKDRLRVEELLEQGS